MNDYRINLNYAKALLMLATDLRQDGEVMSDMKLVSEVCRENHVLNTVFTNPSIRQDKKEGIVRDLFQERVCKTSMAFLIFVVHKHRGVNIKGIANMYMELYREAHNQVVADVMTAVEVNPEHLERIRKIVADFTGKEVEVYSHTTNKMLGSFYLTFGTYLYDARIRTKIAKMRVAFNKNDYEGRF